jgi:hypothetical protein
VLLSAILSAVKLGSRSRAGKTVRTVWYGQINLHQTLTEEKGESEGRDGVLQM